MTPLLFAFSPPLDTTGTETVLLVVTPASFSDLARVESTWFIWWSACTNDPFGFSSFAADLELGIFLSIFSGVGGDLFPAVDLETTLLLPPLFLDGDPFPAPDRFSKFLVMATQKKEMQTLLMRNALVWFWETGKQKWVFLDFEVNMDQGQKKGQRGI